MLAKYRLRSQVVACQPQQSSQLGLLYIYRRLVPTPAGLRIFSGSGRCRQLERNSNSRALFHSLWAISARQATWTPLKGGQRLPQAAQCRETLVWPRSFALSTSSEHCLVAALGLSDDQFCTFIEIHSRGKECQPHGSTGVLSMRARVPMLCVDCIGRLSVRSFGIV